MESVRINLNNLIKRGIKTLENGYVMSGDKNCYKLHTEEGMPLLDCNDKVLIMSTTNHFVLVKNTINNLLVCFTPEEFEIAAT